MAELSLFAEMEFSASPTRAADAQPGRVHYPGDRQDELIACPFHPPS